MKWSSLIGTVATAIFCGALSNPAHAFTAQVFGCGNSAGGDGNTFASLSVDCSVPPVAFGTASASANLATGEMKATVTTFSNLISGIASGGAILGDTLRIEGPFSPTGTIPVMLSMHVDGSMLGMGLGNQAGIFSLLAAGEFGLPSQSVLIISNPDPQGNVSIYGNEGSGTFQNQILSLLPSNIDLILSVQVDVSSAQPTLRFEASAGLTADIGVTLDFSNTAALALVLPQGCTFTSESGVFLSQQAISVPEPGTWMLLGTGLIGLLGYGWRKRRRMA